MKTYPRHHLSTLMISISTLLAVGLVSAADIKLQKPDPYFTAVSPVFGYDPAYGPLLGAAWFAYPSGADERAKRRRDVSLVARFGPHGALSYMQQSPELWDTWGIYFGASLNNFFEYDIDEITNKVINESQQLTVNSFVEAQWAISESWQLNVGPAVSFQSREFEAETFAITPAVRLSRDSRDNPLNPKRGALFSTQARWQPTALSNNALENSLQLQLDGRFFIPVTQSQTLAVRSLVEISHGTELTSEAGGSELLRGYFGSQFSADHMIALQGEYRFPIWKFIRGVGFIDSVSLLTDEQAQYAVTSGLGFRFGLPPDQSMAVRVDIGVTQEGNVLSYINFNHVF